MFVCAVNCSSKEERKSESAGQTFNISQDNCNVQHVQHTNFFYQFHNAIFYLLEIILLYHSYLSVMTHNKGVISNTGLVSED